MFRPPQAYPQPGGPKIVLVSPEGHCGNHKSRRTGPGGPNVASAHSSGSGSRYSRGANQREPEVVFVYPQNFSGNQSSRATNSREPKTYPNQGNPKSHEFPYAESQGQPPRPPPESRPPKATNEDAFRAKIPEGYSTEHWDPREPPILLLGSAFDAKSLGKWVLDWTVSLRGTGSREAMLAGDLFNHLDLFVNSVNRAKRCKGHIVGEGDIEMIQDFLESGDRLRKRWKDLVKICERSMRMDPRATAKPGKRNVCGFVDAMFRPGQMETPELMVGLLTWKKRFNANCLGILSRSGL
ncbi:MAG: hypothetical protein M1839_007013 [Geoglossum umbratile]|nr:MAG: hypothetical protein M1839_007013 [Geoglossum umbratile]